MTADDIIAANPHFTFRPQHIGHFNGLSYVDENGVEQWVIWKGKSLVVSPAPWSKKQLKAARDNLNAAQRGKEFATRGADAYANTLRKAGIEVIKDPITGEPHGIFKNQGA